MSASDAVVLLAPILEVLGLTYLIGNMREAEHRLAASANA
jgi:hypothetical protein